MGFERIFICNSQAFVALLVVGGHLHIEWHVEELERPCCQKSIFFSGSQILERSSRLPWKAKIFAWFKSPPPDGFIFDPLAIVNMKGPQLLTEPNPKTRCSLTFVHLFNRSCNPIFAKLPKFRESQVSQLDFLMLLAAEHLEVTGGIKSSTWEVRFRVGSFRVSMLESLGSLLLDCLWILFYNDPCIRSSIYTCDLPMCVVLL